VTCLGNYSDHDPHSLTRRKLVGPDSEWRGDPGRRARGPGPGPRTSPGSLRPRRPPPGCSVRLRTIAESDSDDHAMMNHKCSHDGDAYRDCRCTTRTPAPTRRPAASGRAHGARAAAAGPPPGPGCVRVKPEPERAAQLRPPPAIMIQARRSLSLSDDPPAASRPGAGRAPGGLNGTPGP
jgi:hypothetical protein